MASIEPAVVDVVEAPLPDDQRRHRLSKQRTVSRGSTVLGVAAMAAVGAGGVAAAQGTSPAPAPVSVPDLAPADAAGPAAHPSSRPAVPDPGESLRTRILAQAREQGSAAEQAEAAQKAAAEAKEAAARKVREEAAAKRRAAADAAVKAEAERLAELAKSYVRPVASYTLTAPFGEASSLWATSHTGQDFTAPTGTPVTAIHSGTIVAAGWAGSFGYRIVLRLDDGTELWYCHLSSVVRESGRVTTGDVIGRVGATGNVTGPHLHLEVRPGGGAPIDPLPWLAEHGVSA